MSVYRSFRLNCACGHEFEAVLWDSINVTEQQDLKQKLVIGHINQIQCEKCKKRSYVEKHLLYHDMDRRLWVQMFPESDRPKWEELEAEHRKTIKKNATIQNYNLRLAFGREELLEKIRIFDRDLDDRVIELMKQKIMEQDDNIKEIADVQLSFSQYLSENGELHFKLTSHEKNLSQTLVVSFDHYEEIVDAKEHLASQAHSPSTVCEGMYINVNKTRTLH